MVTKGPHERSREITEEIMDGKRFSRSIKKITNNKQKLAAAMRMRERSARRALKLGLISPDEIMRADDPDTARSEAERKLEVATGLKKTNYMRLSDDDIDFINSLPDDSSRDIIISELFSKKVLRQFKQYNVQHDNELVKSKDRQLRVPGKKAKKFVELYIQEYNKLLQGQPHKSLQEIREDAGFSHNMLPTTVMSSPWVAMKIETYHQTIEKLSEYHYRQIEDRKLREKERIQDIKDFMLSDYLARPDRLINASIKDSANLLKVLDDMQTGGKKESNSGPPVAIQINSDVANLAMSQNKEKKDHFSKSFNN